MAPAGNGVVDLGDSTDEEELQMRQAVLESKLLAMRQNPTSRLRSA